MGAQSGICGSGAALTLSPTVRLPSGTHRSAGRRPRRGAQQQRPHDGAFRQNQVAGRFPDSDFLFSLKVSFWERERIEILPAVSGLSTQPHICFHEEQIEGGVCKFPLRTQTFPSLLSCDLTHFSVPDVFMRASVTLVWLKSRPAFIRLIETKPGPQSRPLHGASRCY